MANVSTVSSSLCLCAVLLSPASQTIIVREGLVDGRDGLEKLISIASSSEEIAGRCFLLLLGAGPLYVYGGVFPIKKKKQKHLLTDLWSSWSDCAFVLLCYVC